MFQTNGCNQRTIFIKKTHCCNRVHKSVSLRPFHTSWDIYSNNMQQYIHIYIYSHVKCDYGKQKQAQTRTCRSWNVAWPQLTRASANAMNGIGRIWLPIQNPIYSIHKWSMKRFKKLPICRSQRPLPTQLLRSTTPGSSRNGHNCYFKDKKTPARRVGQLRIMFPNDFPFAASKSEWHVIL